MSERNFLALALLGAVGCGAFPFLTGESDTIRIPHERHKKADVDCVTCHETVFDATDFSERHLPKQKTCTGCHKNEQEKCDFCHAGGGEPKTYAAKEQHLKMNHAEHIERVKEDCTQCHESFPEPYAGRSMAPPMARCLGCHEHQEDYDAGRCNKCHTDLVQKPLAPIADFSHRGDFLKRHRVEARSSDSCATCHEQTFCTDCHARTNVVGLQVKLPERVDRAFIHRGDFLGRHSTEAAADGASCRRCHGVSYCQDCHDARGLMPALDRAQDRSFNPHGAGVNDKRSLAFHGIAARRDIASCAACHDQGAASNCVECHKVGGVGGTPHPASWVLRHDKEEIGRDAMCRICHL